MGDYSRDTFRLTNVMHQVLGGQPVANARHYVGVRLQQGVPVLDADWNELEDIRRAEVQALLSYFIGNGVPSNNSGFAITGSGAANNFTIGAGVILVDGVLVFNPQVTTYVAQPDAALVPALTVPPGGLDRADLIYLDTWDQETGALGTTNVDERIVNTFIGVETARRTERRWVVRVAEGETNIDNLVPPPGHRYTSLALLERTAGISAINDNMVIDQRRQGITLADNLKIPLFIRRGLEVIDTQRFALMANGLRTTLFDRLRENTLPYLTAAPDEQRKETLILMSLQELMHLCQIGENQALTGSLNNADALTFLEQLHEAQHDWLDLVEAMGNEGGIAQAFMDDYREFLDGAGNIDGLEPALLAQNLIEAVLAQEALNAWLSSTGDNLPEGNVQALYQTVIPFEALTAGEAYQFTYTVNATFTSPQADEDFNVQVGLNAAFGTAVADRTVLTFEPPDDTATLTITVVPSGVLATADLQVVVTSARNPALQSSQLPITLEINEEPPVATFYYYSGEGFNVDGRLEIPQNHLTRPQGRNIVFSVQNTSASEARTFDITGQVVPNVTNTAGWAPLVATPVEDSPVLLAPNETTAVLVNIIANNPANVPAIGTTGSIVSTATVVVDGNPEVVTVTVPFVVDNPV